MASRYDELDASLELEQRLAADLKRGLEPRGCQVIHNGTNSGGRHAPGGKPDIEIRDIADSRLILVEVTKRKGSAADGEFNAVTDHLSRAVATGGYAHYGMLYVSPRTSARMSVNFRDLYNRTRERNHQAGSIVALDFEAVQLMVDKFVSSDPALYPAERFGEFFERWDEAIDDARARQLVQTALFPEDFSLAQDLKQEAQEFDAQRERDLKKALLKVENDFRSHGITGNDANSTLIYLAFIRLFEERRQRRTGERSRFTLEGFKKWCEQLPAAFRRQYGNRMVEALLREIAEDSDLREAGLLQGTGSHAPSFHPKLADPLVISLILPTFDQYDFHAGRVDVLGAVFETLARRSEKDTRVGQFFTPQQVVDFCADLVDLRPTDVVLDPAVGTGRFLVAAMERMLEDSDEVPASATVVEASIRERQLLGTDIDSWVATIAKMNMFIHGDGKSGVIDANGLALGDVDVFRSAPQGLNSMIDIVLTNPPLGDTDYTVAENAWEKTGGDPARSDEYYEWLGVVPLEVKEETQLQTLIGSLGEIDQQIEDLESLEPADRPKGALTRAYGRRASMVDRMLGLKSRISHNDVTRIPRGRSMKGGALFIGAIAEYLNGQRAENELIEWQGGRAAIVVDEAILNTPDYASVRSFIREHFFIKAVVSLSRDAFKYLAHTDAKTSIIYLIKKPSKELVQREPIFFSHAERVGYSATGEWVGDDLPQVWLCYRVFSDAILKTYNGRHLDPQAALESVRSLTGSGISFYARSPSASRTSARMDFYYARFEQRQEELIEKYGDLTRLGDFLEVASMASPEPSRTGEYDFAVATRTGTIAYKERASVSYAPRDLWIVKAGELVLSSIDLVKGAVAVAGQDVDGLIMSKEMYAYRVRPGASVALEYLQILLRTDAAKDMLLGFTTGTSNRTRLESPSQLLDFPIPPLPSLEEQAVKAASLRRAYEMRYEAAAHLEQLNEEAQEAWGPPKRINQPASSVVRTRAVV
jgi:type I restriction-modification system DNA methylase subunit